MRSGASVVAGRWAGRRLWPMLVLALASGAGVAQTRPDAGSILRDTDQSLPRTPPPQPVPESAPAPAGSAADQARLRVAGFRIEGATLIEPARLEAELADLTGQELTLAELQAAAQRIAALYRREGYLARVLLPQQSIRDGVVSLQVIEGRIGGIDIERAGGARIDGEIAREILAAQQGIGEPASPDAIYRGLRVLNLTPGTEASAVLLPGKAQGEARVLLRLHEVPPFSARAFVDNYGVASSGEGRALAIVRMNNPSAAGDQIELLGLLTEGQRYARVEYARRLGLQGMKLALTGALLDYRLTGAFRGFEGWTTSLGAALSYPLALQPERSLFVVAALQLKQAANDGPGEINLSRKRTGLASVALQGDWQDGVGGGAGNAFELMLAAGDLDLGKNPDNLRFDSQTARSDGGFWKLGGQLSRHQNVSARTALRVSVSGQLAGRNLDSSEDFTLGGPNGVRAYPIGEAAGDEGWLLRADYLLRVNDALRVALFADAGGIRLHRDTWRGWDAGDPALKNHYQLYGAGIGLEATPWPDATFSLALAAPIGDNDGEDRAGRDSDGRNESYRLWAQLALRF